MKKQYWTDAEKEILRKMVNRAARNDFLDPLGDFIEKVQKELEGRNVSSIEHALRRYTDFFQQKAEFQKREKQFITEEKAMQRTLKAEKKQAATAEELKQLKKRYKTLLREVNYEETLKKEMKKIAAFQPAKVRKVVIQPKKRIHESSVLLLSDIHYGETVSKIETQGLAEYNLQIAADRLQTLQDSVIDISQRILAEAYTFDELWVFGLGDWVSGYIHPDLFRSAEVPIVEQSYYLGYIIAQMIQAFAQVFPKVHVEVLSGNHPRLQERVYYKEKWANWDYVTGLFLKELLRNQKNVEVTPLKSFIDFVTVQGHTFALMHGDEIKMGGTMPYYGISRAMYRLEHIEETKFRKLFREIRQERAKGVSNEVLIDRIIEAAKYLADYLVIAHFHDAASLLSESIILNGSVIGPNEYSLGKSLGGPPMQRYFGVHPEKGKTWEYNLKLDSPVKSRFQLPTSTEE